MASHPRGRRPKLTARQKRDATGEQGRADARGRTLWELLEKRVEATPDAEMVVDESGRRLTFAEFKDRGRAGRGRPGRPGHRRRRRRSPGSCRPGSSRWCWSAAISPARRHPEPDPAHLPRARGRLLRPPDRRQAAGRPDRVRPTSTSRRMAEGIAADVRPRPAAPSTCWSATARCPRAIPPPSPRRPTGATRCAGSSTRRAPPPTRRAPGTPTRPSTPWPRAWALHMQLTDGGHQRPGVPVPAHRRHDLAVLEPADRDAQHLPPGVHPRSSWSRCWASRASRWPARAPSSTRPTWPRRSRPTTRSSRRCAPSPAAARRSRRRCSTR